MALGRISFRTLTASIALGTAALFAGAGAAQAIEVKPYSAETLATLQAEGKPVALHFHADWCGTCAEQDKALKVLQSDHSLDRVNLLVVDYDHNKELRKKLKVPSQSLFIVYRGSVEVAREGGQTQPEAIRQLLARAL
jgi:thiol:disulfide interchange protein